MTATMKTLCFSLFPLSIAREWSFVFEHISTDWFLVFGLSPPRVCVWILKREQHAISNNR